MSTVFVRVLVACLLILAFGSCATQPKAPKTPPPPSQEHELGSRPTFEETLQLIDTDQDGKLSADEAQGPLQNDFKRMDTDANGFLTSDEFEKAAPHQHGGPSHVAKESKPMKIDTAGRPIVSVDPTLFVTENLMKAISKEKALLSDGTEAICYRITIRSEPNEHQMGPWCPRHSEDNKEKGGIWFENGHVYDVDGHFLAHLDEFYADPKWELYRKDGSIKVTETQEACEAAARPDVAAEYNNYCVECLPSYYEDKEYVYLIPVTPSPAQTAARFSSRNPLGLAFNGVNFDPPAPTDAILRAHTLAPLDDCGGHVNPHTGYHYHAATGCSKEVAQADGHAPMIGYALDGYGIYALLDKTGEAPTNLDDCRGHADNVRGYHYHVGSAGSNEMIPCLKGAIGLFELAQKED